MPLVDNPANDTALRRLLEWRLLEWLPLSGALDDPEPITTIHPGAPDMRIRLHPPYFALGSRRQINAFDPPFDPHSERARASRAHPPV